MFFLLFDIVSNRLFVSPYCRDILATSQEMLASVIQLVTQRCSSSIDRAFAFAISYHVGY
jgi:hypothetical protein